MLEEASGRGARQLPRHRRAQRRPAARARRRPALRRPGSRAAGSSSTRDDVDLGASSSQSVESARPRAEPRRSSSTSARARAVPVVSGDAAGSRQLIDNLVSNAIKFTPAGGPVVVTPLAPRRSGPARGLRHRHRHPRDERERLFERFFRSQSALDRQIPGTGLGLYISKAIVEAHGGRIGVRSEEGEGTTFVVELPRRRHERAPARPLRRRRRGHPLAGRAAPRARRLRRDHRRVDGDVARSRSSRERRPALAVLDVMMPRRTGYEVLAALRADPSLAGVSR